MWKKRLTAFILILAAVGVGYFADLRLAKKSDFPFVSVSVLHSKYKLGLDLNGGSHLVYKADTSKLTGSDVSDAMTALRDVIERRVNLFGVSEPIVQTEKGGLVGGGEDRLVVELPGVTDVKKAIELIGQTPNLEFKLVRESVKDLSQEELKNKTLDEVFEATALTGRFLEKARLDFDQRTGEPMVTLTFNSEDQPTCVGVTAIQIPPR